MSPYILEAQHLDYQYTDGTKALDSVNMGVRSNCKTAFLGPNGAGKSTLFLHLNGLLKPGRGKLQYKGSDYQYSAAYLKDLRRKVGIVFQNPDNQLFSASVRQDISFGLMNLGFSENAARLKIETVGKQLGITDLFSKPTHFLSLGQKKMVALAGVLVMEPEVLICDEPTAGLDPANAKIIMDALQLLQQNGTAVLLSTHDVDLAYSFSDDIYIMDQGRITRQGSPEEVFADYSVLRKLGMNRPWIMEVWDYLKKTGAVEADLEYPKHREQLMEILAK